MADQLRLDIQVNAQDAQRQLEALAQRVQALPQAAHGAAQGAQQLGNAVTQSGQAAAQAHGAYVSLGAVIGNLPGPLGSAGAAFASMSVHITQAQEGALALSAAMTGVGAGIARGLGAAVGEAAQFQKTFAEVQVVSQASAEQMETLRQKALALGAASTFNSQEVAAGMRELLQAGLTVTETLQAIEPATRGAMLAGQSLDQTTTTLAHTMRQFGLAATDLPHIVDAMTVAAQASTLKFSEFGNLFENLRGRTQNLGIPFEEVTALLITMVNAGVPAAAASTALGTAMDRLGKATKDGTDEASRGIRELGLQVWDANGRFIGFTNLLDQIQAKLPTMTQEQQVHALALLGGARASGAFALTLQQQNNVMVDGQEVTLKGTELTRAYTEQLLHADGVSQRAAATMRATLAIQWQNFNASVQESAIQLGTSFIPALSAALPPVTALVNAFVTAPPAVHQTTAALLAVGAATLTLGGLVLGGTVALAALGPAIAAAGVAAAGVLVPIAAVGVAVAGLSAAWINDWGNIREHTAAAAAVVVEESSGIVAALEGLKTNVGAIAEYFRTHPVRVQVQVTQAPPVQAAGHALEATGPGQFLGTASDQIQAFNDQTEAQVDALDQNINAFLHRGFDQWGATIHAGLVGMGVEFQRGGEQLGTDFVRNLTTAILANFDESRSLEVQAFEGLLADLGARGFDPQTAWNLAAKWFDAVVLSLESRRADAVRAGAAIDDSIAAGMDANRNVVIDASARIASEIGAALQSNKGNIEAAIADVLHVESGPAAVQATAQILQRANAYKAVGEVLNTLTPAERAQYEVMLLSNGANDKVNQSLTVLNAMRDAGTITAEQYTNAVERGSVGLERHTTVHTQATAASRAQVAAVDAETAAVERQEATYRRATAAMSAYGAGRGETGAPGGTHGFETGQTAGAGGGGPELIDPRFPNGGGPSTASVQIGPNANQVEANFYAFAERQMREGIRIRQTAVPTDQPGSGAATIDRPMQLQADTDALKGHTEAVNADKFNVEHLGALTGLALNALTVASGKSSQAFLDQNKAVNASAMHAAALSTGMDFAGAAAARLSAGMLAAGYSAEAAAAAAQQAAEEFKLAAANAQALMNNQMRNAGVQGGVTKQGLTYGEIYANSPTYGGSSSGSSLAMRGATDYAHPAVVVNQTFTGPISNFNRQTALAARAAQRQVWGS